MVGILSREWCHHVVCHLLACLLAGCLQYAPDTNSLLLHVLETTLAKQLDHSLFIVAVKVNVPGKGVLNFHLGTIYVGVQPEGLNTEAYGVTRGKSMVSNVTFLATLHNLFHSYYIMHVFQELVLFPEVHHSQIYYIVENKNISFNFWGCNVTLKIC